MNNGPLPEDLCPEPGCDVCPQPPPEPWMTLIEDMVEIVVEGTPPETQIEVDDVRPE